MKKLILILSALAVIYWTSAFANTASKYEPEIQKAYIQFEASLYKKDIATQKAIITTLISKIALLHSQSSNQTVKEILVILKNLATWTQVEIKKNEDNLLNHWWAWTGNQVWTGSTSPATGSTSTWIIDTEINTWLAQNIYLSNDQDVIAGNWAIVAWYETIWMYEWINIKEIEMQAVGNGASDFISAVQEVVVFDATSKRIIARHSITQNSFKITGLSHYIWETPHKIYVWIKTRAIGKDSAWKQTQDIKLQIMSLKGDGEFSRRETSSSISNNNVINFRVVDVGIKNISFVTEAEWVRTQDKLQNGKNTVGILEIQLGNWANNEQTNGRLLDLVLDHLTLDIYKNNTTTLNNISIERLDGNYEERNWAIINSTGNIQGSFVWNNSNDAILQPWRTVYFAIYADVQKNSSNNNDDYIKVQLNNLYDNSIQYSSFQSNSISIEWVRVNKRTIEASQINE